MTLKYSFQEPVGEIRITEDWSGEGNAIAGLQWPGGVVLRYERTGRGGGCKGSWTGWSGKTPKNRFMFCSQV